MDSESPTDNQQPETNAGTETNKQSDNPTPEVSGTATQPQTKPPPHGNQIACDKKRDWIDKATLGMEGFGLFVLVVYTIATIIYACVTYRMWGEMQTQTTTGQRQFELSERPWIKIIGVEPGGGNVPVIGGLSFQKVGPFKESPDIRIQSSIQIKLSFKNIGHSVADVTPNIEFFMPQFSPTEYWNRISEEEKRFCASPDMSAVTAQKITLFPDESQPFDWYGGISTPIFPKNINHVPEGSGIVPALIVCVSYRHKGLPGLYQTRAVYEISHPGEHGRFFDIGKCDLVPFRNAPMTWCEGGVPANLLKFERNTMGDDAY